MLIAAAGGAVSSGSARLSCLVQGDGRPESFLHLLPSPGSPPPSAAAGWARGTTQEDEGPAGWPFCAGGGWLGARRLRVLRCKAAAPRGVGTGGQVHTTLGLQAGPVGATARRRHEQVLTGPRLYPFVPTPSISAKRPQRDPTKTALSRAPGTSHTMSIEINSF